MTIKEHYDNHLGGIYSWLSGDFSIRCAEFKEFLYQHSITPVSNKLAIDLGAGNGIQSIAMAELGFKVIAVDFNQPLLDELIANANGLQVETINDDIKNLGALNIHPELIVCCGDTIFHLENKTEIKSLFENISNLLSSNGKTIISFRDYSIELKADNRFIPVKSDNNRILTCFLEYEEDSVMVTDLLFEKGNDVWNQKVSFYRKLRLLPTEIIDLLVSFGLVIQFQGEVNGLITIIAEKK